MNFKKFIFKNRYLIIVFLVFIIPVIIFAASYDKLTYDITPNSVAIPLPIYPRQSNNIDVATSSAICVNNTSANTYFVGNKTHAEIQSFIDHMPPGVSQNTSCCLDDACSAGETCSSCPTDCSPCYLSLYYTAGANGTLTGTPSQNVLSGGSGTAVTAVPNSGYVFTHWSGDETSGTNVTANPRTDTNVTANINVTANFAALDAQSTEQLYVGAMASAVSCSLDASWTCGFTYDGPSFNTLHTYIGNSQTTGVCYCVSLLEATHGMSNGDDCVTGVRYTNTAPYPAFCHGIYNSSNNKCEYSGSVSNIGGQYIPTYGYSLSDYGGSNSANTKDDFGRCN